MRLNKKRFRPSMENLENRLVPSAAVRYASGTLTITGDNNPNHVVITGTSPNNVSVAINGATAQIFNNVSNINVTPGNGSTDSVSVTGSATGLAANLNINMGNGNADSVTLDGGAAGAFTGRINVVYGTNTLD